MQGGYQQQAPTNAFTWTLLEQQARKTISELKGGDASNSIHPETGMTLQAAKDILLQVDATL